VSFVPRLIFAFVLLASGVFAHADVDGRRPASQATVSAGQATLWVDRHDATVLLLEGEGVRITAGDAILTADQAVLWLTKVPGLPRQRVDIVLLGNALIRREGVERSGPALAADLLVDGRPTFDFGQRVARDASAEAIFRRALPLRPTETEAADEDPIVAVDPELDTPADPLPDAPAELQSVPVSLQAGQIRTVPDQDGKLAVEVTGGLFVLRREDDGSLLELRADRGVLFTDLDRLDDLGDEARTSADAATGVYLEGDVRVVFTPATDDEPGRRPESREQRLRADQAFYDLLTGEATLTQAVLHTSVDAGRALPLTLRAGVLRRLSTGGFEGLDAEVSTSRFATPTYSLNAGRVFVRPDGQDPGRLVFGGDNVTARLFGVPTFWFPVVRGSTFDARLPLRAVSVGSSGDFGPFVRTRWGLFETFGTTPPRDLDATYELSYFGDRGPRLGLTFDYGGDFLLPTPAGDPVLSLFDGTARAELLDDRGDDNLPGNRPDIDRDGLRYRLDLAHLQFFPGNASLGGTDYAVAARLGLLGDATYLEQWDRRRFRDGLPHDAFAALERRRGIERLAVTVAVQPNAFPTIADATQENAYVQRLPEIEYARFGERLGPFTLVSRNRVGLLQFDTLSRNLGTALNLRNSPGLRSFGQTGTPDTLVPRLDLRQELTLPRTLGPVRVAPFAVARLTAYGDSPDGDAIARGLVGGGVRVGTVLARVDDRVYSRILGIDRLRHLVEPYAIGFASVTTDDPGDVYVFDETVDGYGAILAGRVALRQRWQTYRGPPGRKRGVDVLDIDAGLTLFDDDSDRPLSTSPADLRGLLFSTEPETSLPRDTADARAVWRVSDTTALVADGAVALDDGVLSTAAAGVVANRGPRLGYAVGGRYVRPLDLTLLSASGRYVLSDRYAFFGATRINVDEGRLQDSRLEVRRRFEKVVLSVSFFFDNIDDEGGIRVVLTPSELSFLRLGADGAGFGF
jgi:hypothetical protein